MTKIKVFLSAYACEPHKGSEQGVGWNWVRQIAKFAEVWVITRANNRTVIEEELSKNPVQNLHFVYVDLPRWLKFWKKGQRGVHLYYYLWQFAAYFRGKTLTKKIKFNIVHHITFVNDWIFSSLCFLNIPFIWGPIGSHPPVPIKFLNETRAKILELLRRSVQNFFRCFDPLFFLTVIRAKKVIVINNRITNQFPFALFPHKKFICQVANGITHIDGKKPRGLSDSIIRIISVGRLIYFKGFHLAISAFKMVVETKNNVEFVIVGDGMDRKILESFAEKNQIRKKIKFLGNIPRTEVLKELQETDIFLFPSFEGGGMVVLEAMASALPVVCLDYGGPGEMVTDKCGIKVKPITPEQTINDLAAALLRLIENPNLREKMGEAGRKRVLEQYNWDRKETFIHNLYNKILNLKWF